MADLSKRVTSTIRYWWITIFGILVASTATLKFPNFQTRLPHEAKWL
jgi:hypothetical protein